MAESRLHRSPFLTKEVTALVVLNRPVPKTVSNEDCNVFSRLWNFSTMKICADGGANHLYDATVGTNSKEQVADEHFCPDLIIGDLDSLRIDVKQYYESRKCKIEKDPDQDTNDLDKALKAVHRLIGTRNDGGNTPKDVNIYAPSREKKICVCVYGAFGGRLDQSMASFQALYKWSHAFNYNLILYTEENCACLLPARVDNLIHIDQNLEGPTCGLIPLGSPCENVSTKGLKWNLDGNTPMHFGGLISTSNLIVDDVVSVNCSHPLVWTVQMISTES